MKACPRNSFLRIIAEVSPSPRHILYAVWRFAAPQILHLRINWFLLLLIIRRSAERHFRIVKLRIIPFLLQLKCTQILKKALQNLDFAYKVEDISVPAAHFIHSLEIRRPSNPAFAYKSIPFRTDYTQSCEDAPQNHIFAYKVEDISVPAAHFIRSLEIRRPSNPAFAYKSIPFRTDYTQSCEDAPQNHILRIK